MVTPWGQWTFQGWQAYVTSGVTVSGVTVDVAGVEVDVATMHSDTSSLCMMRNGQQSDTFRGGSEGSIDFPKVASALPVHARSEPSSVRHLPHMVVLGSMDFPKAARVPTVHARSEPSTVRHLPHMVDPS